MDTTTVASPLARTWELLADLASCGQANMTIYDAETLARRIIDLIHDRLACPWGLLLLQNGVTSAHTSAAWGLDAELEQRLIARNGHGLPSEAVELTLHYDGSPAGVLLTSALRRRSR